MLLTAADSLSPRQLAHLCRVADANDQTEEICAAWACKDLLRLALQADDPRASATACGVLTACARADMSKTTHLAQPGHLVPAHPGSAAAAGHRHPDMAWMERNATGTSTIEARTIFVRP